MVSYLPVRPERLDKIRRESGLDPVIRSLRKTILQGWPNQKSSVRPELVPFFNYRDEMSVQDGIVFKSERVMIPKGMRREILQAVHSSHLGIDACLRRARDCVFWPGITADIRYSVEQCETCRTFETGQAKETLMSHKAMGKNRD